VSGGQNWYGQPPAWQPPPVQHPAPQPAALPSYRVRSDEAARRSAERESALKQMVVGGVILVLGAAVSILAHTSSIGGLYGLTEVPALIGLGVLIAGLMRVSRT